MNKRPISPERHYASIAQTLCREPGVTLGTSAKKGFGSSALCINGKIFAMLSSKNDFVVKLPRKRVDLLVAAGSAKRFDPGHGRLMKEWLVVGPRGNEDWLLVAKEAMRFVASKH
jgi:hypothetical protein